jgi:phosphoadenosine phosphosulfate reductase
MRLYALFSGGKDSITMTHYLASLDQLAGVVFIDTGISVPDLQSHIEDVCRKFSWPLETFRTSCDFEEWVIKYGFPQWEGHRWIVSALKGRAIRKFKKAHPREELASGVRLDESTKRFGSAKILSLWEGVRVHSPILNWKNEEVWDYIKKNSLPLSPSYSTLHISGDCLCGAFGTSEELDLIRAFYPSLYQRIRDLEQKCVDTPNDKKKFCKWGGNITNKSLLCNNCNL